MNRKPEILRVIQTEYAKWYGGPKAISFHEHLTVTLLPTFDRVAKLERYFVELHNEIEQTLGRALGYPWFKDDPKNFPGATEADGVCVGEHVAESIAAEAAGRIRKLEAVLADIAALEGSWLNLPGRYESAVAYAKAALGRPLDSLGEVG